MSQTTTSLPPHLDQAPAPDGPPVNGARLELLSAVQPLRLALRAPRLLRGPRGDGRLVVDVPGWKAPEASMAPLRSYLRWLGHDARGWSLGTNDGDPEDAADALVARLDEQGLDRVALLGWSLGGVVCREVARRRPAVVERVVTFGTPVVGGPLHTAGLGSFSAAELDRIERRQAQVDREQPLEVPVTAILSRRDGVVSWLAAIDRTSEQVRHVEVSSSHLGLGLDPDVWLAVAEALA